MSAEIKNNINSLEILTLEFIGSDNKIINILNWFKTLDIVEELTGLFTRGRLILNDAVNLREFYPMNGNEKIHIVWRSGKKSRKRDYTFRILSFPTIENKIEGKSHLYTLNLVDDRYVTLIKKRYTCSHVNKTMSQIMTSLSQHFSLDITVELPVNLTTTQINYLNLHGSGPKMIKDIRYYLNEPLCFFQQENILKFTTYSKLFNQPTKYVLTTLAISTSTDIKNDLVNSVSKIIKSDVYNIEDAYLDGIVGHKYFNLDLWNKTYSLDEYKLKDKYSTGLKYDLNDSLLCNIKYNKSSKYLEDYILSDFITGKINYGLSDLYVGKLVELPMYGRTDRKEVSIYSGTHLISSIQHSFTDSYQYQQSIILIRNKNNI